MPRARLLPLLAAVLVATGCGLPAPYYLAPPGTPAAVANGATPFFLVANTTSNNEPDFKGYELYYKLYKDEASIETGFGPDNQQSQMTGFWSMCSAADTSPSNRSEPLMFIAPADRGQVFTITLKFNPPTEDASYSYFGPSTGAQGPVTVRRFVAGPTGCKTFAYDEFQSTDPDFTAIAVGFNFGFDSIYIGLYALSYGKQDGTKIWSSPVYLGWAKIIP